jgi:hypothetical protein
MTAAVLRLKVTLNDVEPKVLRRIEVPADIKLDRLHLTLQAALGWTNSHLFEIRARDVGWGQPSPDSPDGPLDARKAKLIDVLEDAATKTLRYLYDYGDGWEHTIKVERMAPAEPDAVYPRLIEASGGCPPEDVGGPWGYGEMLEALEDPGHERHDETLEWLGEDFNLNAFAQKPPGGGPWGSVYQPYAPSPKPCPRIRRLRKFNSWAQDSTKGPRDDVGCPDEYLASRRPV